MSVEFIGACANGVYATHNQYPNIEKICVRCYPAEHTSALCYFFLNFETDEELKSSLDWIYEIVKFGQKSGVVLFHKRKRERIYWAQGRNEVTWRPGQEASWRPDVRT